MTQMNSKIEPVKVENGDVKNETVSETTSAKTDDEGADKDSGCNGKKVKPLLICVWFTKYPKASFFTGLGVHILFLIITILLMLTGNDVLEVEFREVPMQLFDNPYLQCYKVHQSMPNLQHPFFLNIPSTPSYRVVELFYFSRSSRNLLTALQLQTIHSFEQQIKQLRNYTNYCIPFAKSTTCQPPYSIIELFAANYEFDNISQTIFPIYNSTKSQSRIARLIHKSASIQPTAVESRLVYSVFSFTNADFVENEVMPLLKSIRKSFKGTDWDFHYFNSSDFFNSLFSQVVLDLLLAVGSLVFIFLFMWFQTQSLFITALGLFSILTSFTGTNLVYRYIFDYKFFGIFHVLSVFIILGIGADDFFVYIDTWRAVGLKYPNSHRDTDSLLMRVSETYRSASVAMLTTSLTTAVAFLCTSVSPLIAISTFGIFSAMLVLVNYLSVILYFPAIVVMYHLNYERLRCCFCCFCCCSNTSSEESKMIVQKPNIIVQFLSNQYFHFINHKITKSVIFIITIVITGLSIYSITKIEPNPEFGEFMKEETMYGQISMIRNNHMTGGSTTRPVEISIIWGLGNLDYKLCHKTDYKCSGSYEADRVFDLNPYPAQIEMLNLCETMLALPKDEIQNLKIKLDDQTGKPELVCFIREMADFYKRESETLTIPWSLSTSQSLVSNNSVFGGVSMNRTFYRNFELALHFWLTKRFNATDPEFVTLYNKYGGLLGATKDENDYKMAGKIPIGYKLRYAAITVNLTFLANKVGFHEAIPVIEKWESVLSDRLGKLTSGSLSKAKLCDINRSPAGFQSTLHWVYIQKSLHDSAILGIIVGISLALPIILLATQNIITTLCFMITISVTTATILALIPIFGWKLGVLEAINLTLVVGMSVDYVVHLAEAYSHAPLSAQHRSERLQYMLQSVAISVLSGAVSTLGSSVFMLGASILFFMQFGVFVFSTIGCAILYSLFLFSALMGTIGPSGCQGDLISGIRYIRARFNKCMCSSKNLKSDDYKS